MYASHRPISAILLESALRPLQPIGAISVPSSFAGIDNRAMRARVAAWFNEFGHGGIDVSRKIQDFDFRSARSSKSSRRSL